MGVFEQSPPATVPGAVTNLHGVRGKTSITVSWAAPQSNGGSPITGYRVTASPGNTTQTVSASSLSVTCLNTKRTTVYTFTVVALNAVGAGPPSSVTVPRG